MNFRTVEIPATALRSLAWDQDTLVDWIGGYRYPLKGEIERFTVGTSYRCDSAIGLGGVGVVFEALGTKGLVRRDSGTRKIGSYSPPSADLVREIDRSYYHANHYPFPVALFQHEGRELLVHCPRRYDMLDIEDIDGNCLTERPREKAAGIFHSRLQVSTNGQWLLSNGWVWQPWRVASVYDIGRALGEPAYLSTHGEEIDLGEQWDGEVEGATLVGDRLVCANSDELMAIAIYNLRETRLEAFVKLSERVGTQIMAIDDDHIVLFDEQPRVLCLSSGEVVHRWEGIEGAKAVPGPTHPDDRQRPPFVAMDPAHARFALGWPNHIVAFLTEQ